MRERKNFGRVRKVWMGKIEGRLIQTMLYPFFGVHIDGGYLIKIQVIADFYHHYK